MKVKDLIEQLFKIDSNLDVVIKVDYDDNLCSAFSHDIQIEVGRDAVYLVGDE